MGRKQAQTTEEALASLRVPIRRNRIYEDVMARIQRLVADGYLRPGDRLPGERELSSALQVSRGSVRQAQRAARSICAWDARCSSARCTAPSTWPSA